MRALNQQVYSLNSAKAKKDFDVVKFGSRLGLLGAKIRDLRPILQPEDYPENGLPNGFILDDIFNAVSQVYCDCEILKRDSKDDGKQRQMDIKACCSGLLDLISRLQGEDPKYKQELKEMRLRYKLLDVNRENSTERFKETGNSGVFESRFLTEKHGRKLSTREESASPSKNTFVNSK